MDPRVLFGIGAALEVLGVLLILAAFVFPPPGLFVAWHYLMAGVPILVAGTILVVRSIPPLFLKGREP